MAVKLTTLFAAAALAAASASASEMPKPPSTRATMQACLATVLTAKPGKAIQVVLKQEGRVAVWEFEIEGKDGKNWDVECSGATGKVVETEERVKSADDPAFKAKAKVGEEAARKTVLDTYPGKVERTEYEIEADGSASYEFDIELKDGSEMRVEVDAASGKIVEASKEYLDIGRVPK